MNGLLHSQGFQRILNAVAAGTTPQTSSTVDMQLYNGLVLLAGFGTITSGAVTSVSAQQSGDDVTYTPIAGSTLTIADTDDNKIVLIELIKPLKRYVQLVISRATQNAVIDFAVAIPYLHRKPPVAASSSLAHYVTVISPS